MDDYDRRDYICKRLEIFDVRTERVEAGRSGFGASTCKTPLLVMRCGWTPLTPLRLPPGDFALPS